MPAPFPVLSWCALFTLYVFKKNKERSDVAYSVPATPHTAWSLPSSVDVENSATLGMQNGHPRPPGMHHGNSITPMVVSRGNSGRPRGNFRLRGRPRVYYRPLGMPRGSLRPLGMQLGNSSLPGMPLGNSSPQVMQPHGNSNEAFPQYRIRPAVPNTWVRMSFFFVDK